jgi:predicted DCC family thiol-disulfide oxidoreductase YuxK
LYDGECSVCSSLAQEVRQRDGGRRLDLLPYQTQDRAGLPPEVSKKDLECALHVILEDGRVTRGAAAVFSVLETLPRPWSWFARLGTLPPLAPVAEALYPLFARHRTFWSRLLHW